MNCRLSTRSSLGGLLLLIGPLMAGRQQLSPPNPTLTPPATNPLIAEGDARYARRQEGRVGERADAREILEAIADYEAAAEAPDSAESRWKLARALYFRGAYTGLKADSRRAVFETARRVSEEAIAILAHRAAARGAGRFDGASPSRVAEALRGDFDATPSFFWAAVAWGEWSLSVGKLTAAKTGAASKIRDYASVVIALDPEFEEGGGYRILGRLHDQAPKLPILTWWVSRKEALRNLRRAVASAPKNLLNLHFLAEALAHGSAAERAEAIRVEEEVVAGAPSPSRLVEQLHIQEEAKRNLANWLGSAAPRASPQAH